MLGPAVLAVVLAPVVAWALGVVQCPHLRCPSRAPNRPGAPNSPCAESGPASGAHHGARAECTTTSRAPLPSRSSSRPGSPLLLGFILLLMVRVVVVPPEHQVLPLLGSLLLRIARVLLESPAVLVLQVREARTRVLRVNVMLGHVGEGLQQQHSSLMGSLFYWRGMRHKPSHVRNV